MSNPVNPYVLMEGVHRLEAWLERNPQFDIDFSFVVGEGTRKTLLMLSACNGHVDASALLLARGADGRLADERGWTPLHFSTIVPRATEIVAMLLDRDGREAVDVDARDAEGNTPLMVAARNRGFDSVRLLVSRGASLDLRNDSGKDARAQADGPTGAFLADVRRAGGWASFVRYPRVKLNLLRVLCERGRAAAPAPIVSANASARANCVVSEALAVLAATSPGFDAEDAERRLVDESASRRCLGRLFPSPKPDSSGTRARAPRLPGRRLPRETFMLILAFWRCTRTYGDGQPPGDASRTSSWLAAARTVTF